MLPSNYFGVSEEENGKNNTFFTIPIDFIKDSNRQSNLSEVQDLFVGQYSDGAYYLLNNTGDELGFVTNDAVGQNLVDQLHNVHVTVLPLEENVQEGNTEEVVLQNKYISNIICSGTDSTEKQNCTQLPLLKNIQPKINTATFKCIKCEKEFEKLSELQSHLRWHNSQKQFMCPYCNTGYKIERNLELHKAIVHSDGNLSKCPICLVNFTSQRMASLKSHLMLHQIEELYACEKCKSEFDDEEEFLKHMVGHSQGDPPSKSNETLPFSCHHCKMNFGNSKDLRRHVSSHVSITRFFQRQKRPNKPKYTISKEKKFVCNICSKAFIKKSLLERHCRIHSGERPFKCSLCDRSFSQKSTLNMHLKKHSGIRPFACTLCPAKFSQKGNLRVHIQKTHTVRTEQVDQLFRCAHCTCVFKKISSLNAHVTRVHVIEKYPTDVDNVLKNLLELEKYTKRPVENNTFEESSGNNEIEQKDYITEDEDESLDNGFDENGSRSVVTLSEVLSDGSLRKYLVKLKKKGETRWYICSYCSKEFKKPSDLIRHIRIHTKEKPYKCHYCKTTFSLKSTLITHMNTHRSDRQFKCVICDRTFKTLRLLNSHIWKHDEMITPPKFQCITCGFLCATEEIGTKHKIHMGEVNGSHVIQPFDNLSLKVAEINLDKDEEGKALSQADYTFICHICGRKYFKKMHLVRHLSLHSGERKHVCQLCHKTVSTAQKLREHLDLHYNIKDCKHCDKKFANANLLKRHMKVHSNYRCPFCMKQWSNAYLLENHIKKEHKMQAKIQEANTNRTGNFGLEMLQNGTIPAVDSVIKADVADNVLVPYLIAPLNDLQILNLEENINSSIQKLYLSVDDEIIGNNDIDVAVPVHETFKPQDSNNLVVHIDSIEESFKQSTAEEFVRTTSVISRAPCKTKPNIIRTSSVDKHKPVCLESSNSVITNTGNILSQLPINSFGNLITDASNSFVSNEPSFLQHSKIICVNCSCLLDDFCAFENHHCNISYITEHAAQLTEEARKSDKGASENNEFKELKSGVDLSKVDNTSQLDTQNSQEIPEKVKGELKRRKKQSKPIECHLCKRTFSAKVDYKTHLKIHSKVRRYECSICKKTISGRLTYMKHLNDVHSDENGSLLRTCKYCSKEFKKPSDLARHLRVHTGEKPFTCQECKRNFSLKSTLESHMRTHKPKVRPFSCPICGVKFTTKATLKVHQTIHTGVKPFKCRFCEMLFRTSGHRKSHVLVAHISNRRRQTESKKARIRKMLESVASTILTDMESDHKSFQDLPQKFASTEVSNVVEPPPSDSLEATAAAVNSITENIVSEDTSPTNVIIQAHIAPIDTPVNINPATIHHSTTPINPIETLNPSVRSDSRITTNSMPDTDQSEPAGCLRSLDMINTDTIIAINTVDGNINQSVDVDNLGCANHLNTNPSISADENVLTSITSDRLIETISFLQQLQPSGMVVSTENDVESIPLILDDVTYLNIESSGEGMQIISLAELEPAIIQTQHSTETPATNTEKPIKVRNHQCNICKKMYASRDVLRKHIKTIHYKDGFLCKECNVKFDKKRKLELHLQQHSNKVIDQDNTVYIEGNDQIAVSSKDALTTIQYDLLTDNISETLFANLFPLKKL